jgi:hypothetical protein
MRPQPYGIFLARTRKNVAQDLSVLPVHEDLSNGFDKVDDKKSHEATVSMTILKEIYFFTQ